MLRVAIGPSDGVGIEVALLIGEVPREQVAHARIHMHDAGTPAGLHTLTEAPHAAEWRQVVSFPMHDHDGWHARPDVLDGVQRFHRRSLTQEPPEVSVVAHVQRR